MRPVRPAEDGIVGHAGAVGDVHYLSSARNGCEHAPDHELTLRAEPAAPRVARHWVMRVVAAAGIGGSINQLIEVLTAELVSDAVRLADEDSQVRVRLRICDSGRGMPDDVAERAFEPFYTTKGSGEGTGLGLATVYGIVTQAGGEVSLTSEVGLGTTITVLLPAGAAPAHTEVAERPAVTEGNGETLLVAEDEDALRDVAGRILTGEVWQALERMPPPPSRGGVAEPVAGEAS